MDLFVDDAGFVRAPAPLVYRRLTDVGGWPRWWPGVRVARRQDEASDVASPHGERWGLDLPAGRLQQLRVDAVFHSWRLDTGVAMRLSGGVEGDAEFWLEPTSGGTVVHHVLSGRTAFRAPRRIHDGYRRAVRRGLWGLKDALHLEARTMAGLGP